MRIWLLILSGFSSSIPGWQLCVPEQLFGHFAVDIRGVGSATFRFGVSGGHDTSADTNTKRGDKRACRLTGHSSARLCGCDCSGALGAVPLTNREVTLVGSWPLTRALGRRVWVGGIRPAPGCARRAL